MALIEFLTADLDGLSPHSYEAFMAESAAGQFEIGLHSAFFFADPIPVTGKCTTFQYSTSRNPAPRTVLGDGRSTRLTLRLRRAHTTTSREKPKEIARKYSQFIQFPFYG